MTQKRINLLGLFIDDTDTRGAVELAERALSGVGALFFVTPNLELLHGARVSEAARRILNSSDVALPDGVGLKLVSALLGKQLKNRVAGIDFGMSLLHLCEKKGARVFFLGGKDGVAEAAAANLQKMLPELQICGARDGYFDKDEEKDICEQIERARADVLLVCRGFPRQENFIYSNRQRLPSVKLFAALGGSLDVWAEKTKRAPLLLQKCGLEWLWRIASEPERLDRLLLCIPTIAVALKTFLCNTFTPESIFVPRKAYNQVKK